jgi:hypothetical protein
MFPLLLLSTLDGNRRTRRTTDQSCTSTDSLGGQSAVSETNASASESTCCCHWNLKSPTDWPRARLKKETFRQVTSSVWPGCLFVPDCGMLKIRAPFFGRGCPIQVNKGATRRSRNGKQYINRFTYGPCVNRRLLGRAR